MTPELKAFLLSDPEHVPVVRLFHIEFDTVSYYLNEGVIPVTFGGQVWQPCNGWFSAEPIQISGSPFDATPAVYNCWGLRSREGAAMAEQALNQPDLWSGKTIRQLVGYNGFPDDMLVLHTGRMVSVIAQESVSDASITIRAESIAAYRNYTPLGEYTPRDQARRYPGITDKGFDYVASMPGKKIKGWLRA